MDGQGQVLRIRNEKLSTGAAESLAMHRVSIVEYDVHLGSKLPTKSNECCKYLSGE